jgi:hypothetical protein
MATAEQLNWDPEFTPWHTPMEMLDLGIMQDAYYFPATKGLPSKYTNHPKALKRGDTKDPKQNHFGVASRQSWDEWKRKGWLHPEDPAGWIEWYFKYYEGRRLPKEDQRQIKRWKSFIARHQAQIVHSGQLKDLDARKKQRQALLHWAWDSTKEFTAENRKKALDRILKTAAKPKPALAEESLKGSMLW